MQLLSKLKQHLGLIFFIIFLILLIVLTYKDYGITWDEKVVLNTSKYFLEKILHFLGIPSNLNSAGFQPPWYQAQGHGILYDLLQIVVTPFFGEFNFAKYHLIKALFAIPTFIILYLMVNKLLGKTYAFLSLVFLLLFPRFYGHIFTNISDVPAVLFFSASIYCLLAFINSRQNFWQQVLFGAVMAITVSQRILFFYLVLINFFILFFSEFYSKKTTLRTLILKFATVTFSFIFFLHLTHPYLITHPIFGLFDVVKISTNLPWYASVLYDGKFILASALPPDYLVKSMLITIPESIIFLFAAGNLYLLYKLFKVREKLENRLIYFYLLLIFYIPLVMNLILRPVIYDSWRHFMFLTFPIIIVACFGLKFVLNLKNKIIKSTLIILIVINLGFVIYEMVSLYPFEYIYYNSFVGGLPGAYGKYETEYFGESYKEATQWFIKNINDGHSKYKIKTEGDPLSSYYYFTKNMIWTADTNQADYVFSFTRWNLHKLYPGKIVHTIERRGVPLVFIIKKI